MPENRRLERVQLSCHLNVFDLNKERLIGPLLDITIEGLMVMSQHRIKDGALYHLRIELPEEIGGQKMLTFQAESVWTEKDFDPGFYNTGFQLLKVSSNNIKIIETLIEKYRISD